MTTHKNHKGILTYSTLCKNYCDTAVIETHFIFSAFTKQ